MVFPIALAARLGMRFVQQRIQARILARELRGVFREMRGLQRDSLEVVRTTPTIDITAKVHGLDQIKRNLRRYTDKMRRKIVRAALAEGARLVRDTSRANAPILNLMIRGNVRALRRGVRRVGTVKKSIKVLSRRSREGGTLIRTSVAVAPAKGARRGAKSPNDPFYWRFLEFGYTPSGPGGEARVPIRGRKKAATPQPARGFMRAGVATLPKAAQLIVRRIQLETEGFNRNPTG